MTRNRFSRDMSSFRRKNTSLQIFAVLTFFLSLSSCYNEPNTLGEGLFSGDKITPQIDTLSVSAFSIETDTLVITKNQSQQSQIMLGCYNDRMFGSIKTNVYTRFFQYNTDDTLLKHQVRPTADSLFLTLYLIRPWGENNKSINIRVYELTDSISSRMYYNSLKKPRISYDMLNPIDSQTTYSGSGQLKIMFKKAFANKIISSSETILKSQKEFYKAFKGLLITCDSINDSKGVLYSFNSNGTFTLHYQKTTPDNKKKNAIYYLGLSSLNLNHYSHNYSAAVLGEISKVKIDDFNESTVEDTVFYLSGLGGIRGLIKFKEITPLRESMPVAIHRAELSFDIQPSEQVLDSSMKNIFAYSYRKYESRNDSIRNVYNVALADKYTTFSYNRAKQSFNLDVTIQLQNLLRSKSKKDYFFIESTDFQDVYMQGVYRSGKNSKPMKLIITYSKL